MQRLDIIGYIGDREEELEQVLSAEDIGQNFTADMAREYIKENANEPELHIYIDSIGGDVIQGFEIKDLLEAEKGNGKKIFTYGKEFSSIASLIYLAGDVRKSYKNSDSYIHDTWRSAQDLGDVQLNKDTLKAIARANEAADEDILFEYVKVAGRERREELKTMMQAETKLTDKMLLDLGFSHEIIDDKRGSATGKKSLKSLAINSKIFALLKTNNNEVEGYADNNEGIENQNKSLIKKSLEMEKPTMEAAKISNLEKMFSGLQNTINSLFGNKLKNLTLKVGDNETEIYVASEDGEIEGKTAYLVKDGVRTDELAPAGTHQLQDGKTITISESGVIESVSVSDAAKADSEMEEAMAVKDREMEEMQAKFQEMENSLANAKEENDKLKSQANETKEEIQGQLAGLKAEMAKIKSEVPHDEKEVDGKKAEKTNEKGERIFNVRGTEKSEKELTSLDKAYLTALRNTRKK